MGVGMTIEQLELELEKPELRKYAKYLESFYSLTSDEKDRVRSRHPGIDRYLTIQTKVMKFYSEQLSKALQAGGDVAPSKLSQGSALKFETLCATLRLVTFDIKEQQ
jgi:hypothetical protein